MNTSPCFPPFTKGNYLLLFASVEVDLSLLSLLRLFITASDNGVHWKIVLILFLLIFLLNDPV